ncbi:MAG: T9SS type A sorting domain-containing protein [FCB group bacterium]|nr:T9SS type A sorting domain-containing protein [FCB group bacterium]
MREKTAILLVVLLVYFASLSGATIIFDDRIDYLAGRGPCSVIYADVDGDGHQDLISANCYTDDVSVLLNSGDGSFLTAANYGVGDGPRIVIASDFDNDGNLDLAAVYSGRENVADSEGVSVLINTGAGTFLPADTYDFAGDPESIHASDLDGDGFNDLIAVSAMYDQVATFLNKGDGTFNTPSLYETGDYPYSVYSVDLDDNGIKEILVANYMGSSVSVFPVHNDGTLLPRTDYPVGFAVRCVRAADLNNDGYPDIIATNGGSSSVSILLGNMCGVFPPEVRYNTGGSVPTVAIPADLDGDGDLDIAVSHYGTSVVGVLQNNGNGTFTYPVTFPAGEGCWSVCAADIDGDNDIDLASAGYKSWDVSVFINGQNSHTTADDNDFVLLPNNYSISQNHPNPFNPATTIDFTLPKQSYVTIEVFNLLGERIRTLLNESKSAGQHAIVWNGTDENNQSVASGIYLYRIMAEDFIQARQMILMK